MMSKYKTKVLQVVSNGVTSVLHWAYSVLCVEVSLYHKLSKLKRRMGVTKISFVFICRADSWLAPSQWETLQINAISHWLGANLETDISSSMMGRCMLSMAMIITTKLSCNKSEKQWYPTTEIIGISTHTHIPYFFHGQNISNFCRIWGYISFNRKYKNIWF